MGLPTKQQEIIDLLNSTSNANAPMSKADIAAAVGLSDFEAGIVLRDMIDNLNLEFDALTGYKITADYLKFITPKTDTGTGTGGAGTGGNGTGGGTGTGTGTGTGGNATVLGNGNASNAANPSGVKLFDYDANPNDRVYDVVRGLGTVSRIDADRDMIYIQFDSTGDAEFAYKPDGQLAGSSAPTLYWHPPILFNPPKDDSDWQMLYRISQFIYQELRNRKGK